MKIVNLEVVKYNYPMYVVTQMKKMCSTVQYDEIVKDSAQ